MLSHGDNECLCAPVRECARIRFVRVYVRVDSVHWHHACVSGRLGNYFEPHSVLEKALRVGLPLRSSAVKGYVTHT